jgi:hypothetical protein
LSRIIGGGMAVRHAVQMHRLSSQVARQNTSRIITPPRAQVAEVVGEIVEVAPTTEDLQRFIDIVSREVDDPGLEYDHRSEPQTQVADSRMIASVGARILGSSRSSTRTSPGHGGQLHAWWRSQRS